MGYTTLHAQHRIAVLVVPRAVSKHFRSVPCRCGARGPRDARLHGCCTAPCQYSWLEPSTASRLAIHMEAHEGPSAPSTALQKSYSQPRGENKPGSRILGVWVLQPPRSEPPVFPPGLLQHPLPPGPRALRAPLPSFELARPARPRNLLLSGTADERRDKFRKKSLCGSEEKHRGRWNPSCGATAWFPSVLLPSARASCWESRRALRAFRFS